MSRHTTPAQVSPPDVFRRLRRLTAHFGQQLETISNQATAGSRGFGEEEGK
jgi:hypothetical protein